MFSEEIKKLIENGTLFFCSHSGGKDSQAMYLYLKKIIPKDQLIVIHADLGHVEWEGTFKHIENTVSHEIVKVRAKKSFFEMVEHRTMWPSSMSRQCTSDLKTKPIFDEIKKIMKEKGVNTIVNCMGLRAEESSARAKKAVFEYNEKQSAKTKNRHVYNWNPVFNWSTREVFRFILDNEQKPHWAYEKGMSRLSCCFCILANRQDLKESSMHNPALLDEYEKLEKKIGHTVFMHQKEPIGIKEYINLPYKREPKKLIRLRDCY